MSSQICLNEVGGGVNFHPPIPVTPLGNSEVWAWDTQQNKVVDIDTNWKSIRRPGENFY